MEISVEIRGLQALEARLVEIGGLASAGILRRVMRKVAKPMLESAQAGAVSVARSGALYRSLGIVNRRPKGAQVAAIAVTSRAKERVALRMHNDAYRRQRKGIFYGWMVDRGTVNAQARPWWTPAVNATEPRATISFINELRKAVERIEKRKGRIPSPDSVVPQ